MRTETHLLLELTATDQTRSPNDTEPITWQVTSSSLSSLLTCSRLTYDKTQTPGNIVITVITAHLQPTHLWQGTNTSSTQPHWTITIYRSLYTRV